jgi:4-amino-4-deoxy-L-arabinose transferase-like glycosyltransferase
MNRRLSLSVVVLFVLWLFFVLASFFAVQKPFTAANAAAIGAALLNLLTALWLGLIALGLGSWLLTRLAPPALPWPDVVIFGTGLGLGMLGLLSFGVGLLGGFTPLIAYPVTIILTAASLPPLWRLKGMMTRPPAPPPAALIYLALLFLLTLSVALLPPADWDGLFYHLTGPKLYLQAGGIASIASSIDIPHLSFPSLMEMLFAWAMLLRGDIAAKLLHGLYGLLLAGLVYRLALRFWGQKSAWLALLVFAGMPMVNILAGWAYNDLALAFYQLAALYWLINYQWSMVNGQWSKEDGTAAHSSLIISGIFAGLAMGLKYTSFVTPFFIVIVIIYDGIRNNHRSTIRHSPFVIRNLLAFALPALLVAAPWYIKNWAFTGNPVYPFLFDVFGGHLWDSFRAEWYAAGGSGIGFNPSTLLALPWLLTLGVRDANYWDGRTGPLLLLFLPLILFGLFRRADTRRPYALLFIFALVHFLFWTAGVMWSKSLWQSRLLLPGLTALTPLVGAVWADLSRFDRPRFSLSRFVNAAVALTLALTLLDIGLLTLKFDPLPYLVGQESQSACLTRRLGAHYAAMEQINRELPPEAVVVFLWEPRSYYCQRDCRPDSILDEFPHLVHQYGSAAAIAGHWRDIGVTHVLIHRDGLRFVQNESPDSMDWPVLAALQADFLAQTADVFGAYQLYQLQ